ncbi:MAG: hypothetical protein QOE76_55 [Frankiales bacterium]|nr:hypothetical protein [Frankiales bacterium]
MTVLIGTSGWQYASWKAPYYGRTPQRQWYEKVLTDFRTVELNVSFYRLPKLETFQGWARRGPDDAVVTVKASRYLTHIKRLKDPQPSVALLMERASGLGNRLGPVLVQLPPDLRADPDNLAATLDAFPAGVRVAVEPRHESWWSDEVREVLTRRNAALVWADRLGKPMGPLWRTAEWGYLRMHEGRAHPWPFYGRTALQTWAARLQETFGDDADTYVYFNNDPRCAAVDNAITFGQALDRLGVARSRTPAHRPQLSAAA